MTTRALHEAGAPHRAVAALKRFTARPATLPLCDLCAAPMGEAHDHLLESRERRVVCACRACALLFPETGGGTYRHLESRATRLGDLVLTEDHFRGLGIPVRLAFLGPSLVHDCLFAVYPNAGGATESTLRRASWDTLVLAHPALAAIQPDTEGLFVNASGDSFDAYRVSIDVCFRMVGALRANPGRPFALRTDITRLLRDFGDPRGHAHG